MTRTQMEKEKRKQRLFAESKKALAQRIAALETRIGETEAQIQQLEAQMGNPQVYKIPEEARRLAQEHAQAQSLLDSLYAEWTETSDALDAQNNPEK